ncbi:MAG: hypothetical protein ATN32_00420 [Candidatus Epulonipiscium fishelsonii]|nr:MAG: hypothetical protein ATN32_00420 [Epulopiscium sp. AS2M-Bin002]
MEGTANMNINENVYKKILDEMNDIIYISDINTYELYFLNKQGMKQFNFKHETEWHNHKCYELLQGRDTPCDLCAKNKLSYNKFCEWTFYNLKTEQYYDFKNKLINLDDKPYRLEVAYISTKRVQIQKKLYHITNFFAIKYNNQDKDLN